jgi:hypothetical protein
MFTQLYHFAVLPLLTSIGWLAPTPSADNSPSTTVAVEPSVSVGPRPSSFLASAAQDHVQCKLVLDGGPHSALIRLAFCLVVICIACHCIKVALAVMIECRRLFCNRRKSQRIQRRRSSSRSSRLRALPSSDADSDSEFKHGDQFAVSEEPLMIVAPVRAAAAAAAAAIVAPFGGIKVVDSDSDDDDKKNNTTLAAPLLIREPSDPAIKTIPAASQCSTVCTAVFVVAVAIVALAGVVFAVTEAFKPRMRYESYVERVWSHYNTVTWVDTIRSLWNSGTITKTVNDALTYLLPAFWLVFGAVGSVFSFYLRFGPRFSCGCCCCCCCRRCRKQ